MKGVIAAVAVAGLISMTAAGCSSGEVTAGRLQAAVGPTFARMYILQQNDLGHMPQKVDSSAACKQSSGGATTWTCTVHYPFPDGHIEGVALDVEVQPIGCYTASAPTTLVGAQRIRTQHGTLVTNPLFAFDGCFTLE